MRGLFQALLIWIVVAAGLTGATADDREWPSQLTIAGFVVTNIRPEGSDSAIGQLQIPGDGTQRVSLTRGSGGSVTGRLRMGARTAGADIRGDFELNRSGLKGDDCTVGLSGKSITDAGITVRPGGQFSGEGRVELGRVGSVKVSFTISGSLRADGTASIRDEKDTPLATYKFDGRLNIEGGFGRLTATADGNVTRTGKMADQVTTHKVSGAQINLNDGSCTVNVGGVGVTFRFF